MDEALAAWRQHLALKQLLADIRLDLTRLEYLRKAGFDPQQPRDELGRWIGDGGNASESAGESTDLSAARSSRAKRAALEAFCLAQYASDTFHCTMVGSRACHEQAALRYSNCLNGRPIPPLNY